MLADRSRRAILAATQVDERSSNSVTARLHQEDFSSKVLEGTPLTLDEVADFLELQNSPENQRWAARALAYATALNNPLDRMAGLALARAWLVTTPPARLRQPAGRLRLHALADG